MAVNEEFRPSFTRTRNLSAGESRRSDRDQEYLHQCHVIPSTVDLAPDGANLGIGR